jgi:AcrR family transcriptional regulator
VYYDEKVPRLADHEERRRAIVEALWRVMARDGVEAVSVRTVAIEAGMSPTALRYYFASQGSLLEDAMRMVIERVAARVRPLLVLEPADVDVASLLAELLPLDQGRRVEQATYLAFAVRAQTLPRLRALRDDADIRLHEVIAFAVRALDCQGHLAPDRDVRAEAARLYALIDGLAFQGALSPQHHTADALTRVLGAHLEELARPVS